MDRSYNRTILVLTALAMMLGISFSDAVQAQVQFVVGEAILRVKQSVAPWNSMIHNWMLLGDPALPLR